MKSFITIYLNDKNNRMLDDFCKSFFGMYLNKVERDNTITYIINSDNDISLLEFASAVNYELLISSKVFMSKPFNDDRLLNEYLEMVLKVNPQYLLSINNTESDLILNKLGDSNLIKKTIFGNDFQLENVIKTYLDLNMNISKASQVLYMHRNTLMNKIDKFIATSGYDIKLFKDAFVIYHLFID